MTVLFPQLAFEKDESLLGFAARLAAFHADNRTGLFLRDMNIKISDLARGQEDAINHLAICSGVPTHDLVANVPRGLGHRGYELRGEMVSSEFLTSPHTVFCPACLAEDDRASGGVTQFRRHVWYWQVRGIRTCMVHGLPLMSRKGGSYSDQFHELAIVVPETGESLEDLVPKRDPRPISPLQSYILGRLNGVKGPKWLDAEGLEQSVHACEMLGVLLAYGATPNLNELTEDDRDHAGAVGFRYAAQGEVGIRQALTEVQQSSKYNGSNAGGQKVFGRLYQWLAQSRSKKDPGDIKRILREHIFDTMPVPTNGIVLGEKLSARRLHTCASLARETGVDPRTLHGMLIAKRLLPEGASEADYHVFDSALGLEIAHSMGRLVPVTQVPKALSCTRPLVDQLLSERILTPVVSELSHAPGRTKKSIDTLEIDQLLRSMERRSMPVSELPAGMVDLATAAMKSKAPAVEIVHLILGGFLSNVVSVEGVAGVAAIHVDPNETKDAIARILVGLSPEEAFIRLGIPFPSGWELVNASPDHVHLPTIDINAEQGNHVIRRIRVEDVDAFLAEYTTEKRIGSVLGIGVRDLKGLMKAARAKPICSKTEIGVRIFRRIDLPEQFQV